MDFPRTIAGQHFESAPAFAVAVQADALAGGSTIVEGARPTQWLAASLRAGEVDRTFVIALCAALMRNRAPVAVAEAAALAGACELSELSEVLSAAASGLDVGVLLFPDPNVEDGSVEDALLTGWAAVEQDVERCEGLLDRLRYAGLRDVELRLLMRLATPASIRARLPQILAEALPAEDAGALAMGMVRSSDVAQAIVKGASALNAAQRYAIWHAAVNAQASLASDSELQASWLAGGEAATDGPIH
ncbi:MAG: hypothetical protein AB8H79_01490 [Myxococcota bacterium]